MATDCATTVSVIVILDFPGIYVKNRLVMNVKMVAQTMDVVTWVNAGANQGMKVMIVLN
jgi:hypothetical protein|tara:strand:+ start:308 stop:484 length:177 start_codon:yes stop_codon:yes gene_type:complete